MLRPTMAYLGGEHRQTKLTLFCHSGANAKRGFMQTGVGESSVSLPKERLFQNEIYFLMKAIRK
jgi:hypothetical protein